MIRQATIHDAPRIAEIHVASWRATYRGLVPDMWLASLSVSEREVVWKEFCSNEGGPVYVACDGEQIFGFCHIAASRDLAAERTAEITSIYIDPGSLRNGHGRLLFSEALSYACTQGFREVTLWVLMENQVARQFYEAMGLHPDGATKTEGRLSEVRYRGDLTEVDRDGEGHSEA